MSFLSNLLNPFSSRNPLRPDNLIKDPFGITASDLGDHPQKVIP